MGKLLEVKNLAVQFKTREGPIHAVNGVSFDVNEGESIGIVGESGSGKSVTSLAIMRLLPVPPAQILDSSSVLFEDRQLVDLEESEMRKVRGGQMAMIFQEPMTSLNPVLTIGRQLIEPIEIHLNMHGAEAEAHATSLLESVGIPDAKRRLGAYPHEFSGGMRQRVMIAMALSCRPKLLIADEPTTALDVTVQAQILELISSLRREFGTSVMLITHDLGVVAGTTDRVLVMYAGHIAESGPTDELFANPRHPYTLGLLGAIPRLDDDRQGELSTIPGSPPDLLHPPTGCPFQPRCAFAIDKCKQYPPYVTVGPNHQSACWVDVTDPNAQERAKLKGFIPVESVGRSGGGAQYASNATE